MPPAPTREPRSAGAVRQTKKANGSCTPQKSSAFKSSFGVAAGELHSRIVLCHTPCKRYHRPAPGQGIKNRQHQSAAIIAQVSFLWQDAERPGEGALVHSVSQPKRLLRHPQNKILPPPSGRRSGRGAAALKSRQRRGVCGRGAALQKSSDGSLHRRRGGSRLRKSLAGPPHCSLRWSWRRSAIMAINSELVGFPLALETV